MKYTVDLKIGLNMVAHHAIVGKNRLVDIFPEAPIGTTVFFFDEKKGFSTAVFLGQWSTMADRVINPGDGFIINVRAPFKLKVKGLAADKLETRALLPGQHVIGNLRPERGSFETVVGRKPMIGETLHKGVPLGKGEDDYDKFAFTETGWVPREPKLAIGEAAWIGLKAPSFPVAKQSTDK